MARGWIGGGSGRPARGLSERWVDVNGACRWCHWSLTWIVRDLSVLTNYAPAEGQRMCMGHRCAYLLLSLLVGLAGCGSGQTAASVSPSNRPTSVVSATPDTARCTRLARLGFVPCPPLPSQMKLPPTTIRNATGGAVSDATARRWGRAFQLSQAYYYWVMQHGDRDALTSGALADSSPQAVANMFGSDLEDLDISKREAGSFEYEPPSMPVVQIVTVPGRLQEMIANQHLTASTYAVAVKLTGPTRRVIRYQNGKFKVIASADSTYHVELLIWGTLQHDRDLGDIWYGYGLYGCSGIVGDVCKL
jgi:hypothetical protein